MFLSMLLKFVIWMRIDQVIRLCNNINFSETAFISHEGRALFYFESFPSLLMICLYQPFLLFGPLDSTQCLLRTGD